MDRGLGSWSGPPNRRRKRASARGLPEGADKHRPKGIEVTLTASSRVRSIRGVNSSSAHLVTSRPKPEIPGAFCRFHAPGPSARRLVRCRHSGVSRRQPAAQRARIDPPCLHGRGSQHDEHHYPNHRRRSAFSAPIGSHGPGERAVGQCFIIGVVEKAIAMNLLPGLWTCP